ncbi:Dephospho-CoA kinase [Moorella thermoacetica]|uniref:Dephospho-CoA kinase n=1 Tax=Neomoorella thermoacetica TaxID=1525 RepID=A0AAC9MVN9_NEOTH|nr:AAA family ATPase [Moorella thermoacetica]AOQ24617.1 hypothetical protein Maut_02189 [Moorella thermoacetica]TYL12720.1 Dephospho-CoA kinase [Moorella thermoacetica]
MRLLLIGKAGAGKDTVADYLVEKYGFQRFAFADKLKEIIQDLWPDAFKNGKPRKLLQDVGTKMREIDKDVWVNYVMRQIGNKDRVVISDCRLMNEYEIAVRYDFVPILIKCDEKVRLERLKKRDGHVLSNAEANHESETEMTKMSAGFTINNSGSLQALYWDIDYVMRYLGVRPCLIQGA